MVPEENQIQMRSSTLIVEPNVPGAVSTISK